MRHFFVTGLPRSRTAWFANLLTYANSFCFHDAFVGLSKPEQIFAKFYAVPRSVVGNSDPANLILWDRLVEWFPKAQWIVVKRDFEEVVESCRANFGEVDRPTLWKQSDELNRLTEKTKAHVVRFDNITPKSVAEVASFLGVHLGPVQRVEMLCEMNVQKDQKILKQQLKVIQQNPPDWIREAVAA